MIFRALLCMTAASALLSCNRDEVVEQEPDKDSATGATPRPVTPESSASDVKVFEWRPAPGQFINETTMIAELDGDVSPESAARWAQSRLSDNLYVSLGAFGGYIVVGFDHSIHRSGKDYDFAILGNAFYQAGTTSGGSSEPGIIYVMQDENGNGLPDDTWYELRGSDSFEPETIRDYQVTYYRPETDGMAVEWKDNKGNSGSVDYLKFFHKQPTYYPAWIAEESYTLSGPCLESRTLRDENGFWVNNPFGWGYADNMGSDNLMVIAGQQANGFRISDAVNPDGKAVSLDFIDFVKVQTAVCAKSSLLGEVSTEVLGFIDLSLNENK